MQKQPQNDAFDIGTFVVHPAHGVGKIQAYETQTINGCEFKAFVVVFERERLTVRVPFSRVASSGLRLLSTESCINNALKALKKPLSLQKKAIWARRAQELQTKLNSGSIQSLAEVIAELGYGGNIDTQSYSERRFFYTALERFIEEWSYVSAISNEKAQQKIADLLKKQVS